MRGDSFLVSFQSVFIWFFILALGIFFVERKEYLNTYTEVTRRYTGQTPLIRWIPKLLKYLLVAAVLAFVISAIFYTLDSL